MAASTGVPSCVTTTRRLCAAAGTAVNVISSRTARIDRIPIRSIGVFAWVLSAQLVCAVAAFAQDPEQPPPVHEHVDVPAALLMPSREASGTGWLPQSTPMYGLHQPWRGWDVRLNGDVFALLLYEPGGRHRTGGFGTWQFAGVNWGMAMLRRAVGNGRFGVRTMISLEAATMPGCGSLNYLAIGDICDGDTVHDRQQAHDVLMELAADYEAPLSGAWRWQVYGAAAGEPAFGPAGYAHRPSAFGNPLRPVAHHWLDSTSVTFGVATLGIHNAAWKVEGSAFNGRNMDANRVDVDFGAFDSFSGRVSFLPTQNLAMQVSAGRIREVRTVTIREPLGTDTRATASVSYHRPFGDNGIWATTAAYGITRGIESAAGTLYNITSDAGLLESSVTLDNTHTIFGRLEAVGMPAHHLHAHEFRGDVYAVGKVQGGYLRHFASRRGLVPGLGGTVALSILPAAFAPRYSGTIAPTFSVFFNLRPARHAM
jgi:hypothetical protein